jgi:CDP-glucose 4,6-dehydratase
MFGSFYEGKTVWVSGHTGFKGSWLTAWLLELGAKVTGYSLPAERDSLFELLSLRERVTHLEGDVRDRASVRKSLLDCQPDVVLHLAAQPLVRRSYEIPVETYDVNVMGTVHILDALRGQERPCAAVFVTTDKCYENREWLHGYRESDPLGGHDPYSSSKAMAELAISAYRDSFFKGHPVHIASARAGNVIGGGDWAKDRIVPDCIRALACGEPIPVRNVRSTRPWQHVLEPLNGYLSLASQMHGSAEARADSLSSAFNFGPALESNRTVKELVAEVLKHWPGSWVDRSDPNALHEAGKLNLSTDKAFHELSWAPVWGFQSAVFRTVEWYRKVAADPSVAGAVTISQIQAYTQAASASL